MALTKLTKNLIDGTFGTEWVSTIQTSNFTAVAGKGYFVNTTSAEITITLPVGVVGTEIVIQDYAGTFATNKVIFASNGSEKIQGTVFDYRCVTNNATVTLIYQDATKGWTADNIEVDIPPLTVDYLVVAGGGGGGGQVGGGGGAGGLLTNYNGTPSTLTAATDYTITVGAGGNAGQVSGGGNPSGGIVGTNGSDSIFSTVTATGGGYGGAWVTTAGATGGSGGGGGAQSGVNGTAGLATSSPTQGNAGGTGLNAQWSGGGGGGAGAAGTSAGSSIGGNGGNGLAVNILSSTNAAAASIGEINGSDVYFSGGGGGSGSTISAAPGGTGGGGNGGYTSGGPTSTQLAPTDGTANTGGGGGGARDTGATGFANGSDAGAGGSGVVIIRYPSSYTVSGLAQASGSPFTEGTDKVSVFTAGTGNIQFN